MARAAVARAAALDGGSDNRYPSGKLKPTHPPATIKRVVEVALRSGANQWLGTPLGWLHLNGELSAKQCSAGLEYARLRSRYDHVMGYPRRSARTLGFGNHRFGGGDETSMSDIDIASVRRQFETLRDRIVGTNRNGVKIISLLDDVCVDLQMPSWSDQIMLRQALDKVGELFKLGAT